jgi:hypothetical protein
VLYSAAEKFRLFVMPPENFIKFISVISKIYNSKKCCEKCLA